MCYNIKRMTSPVLLNNRYRLEGRLGSGGMAVVYRAHDLMLERTVAVKVLRKDFSTNFAFRDRFHQEAKAAANLSHPNIVMVHDYGLASGYPFIVMEYVPGTDLKQILQHRGNFSVRETLDLMIQACAGLGYAHRAGLVHCDIKPHNMLITPDQRLKITDFGIARALASIRPDERAEFVWGSPLYFSPEQAAGGAPLPASDVYSLGVVMYEMLTGRLPFQGDSATVLSHLHQVSAVPSPRSLNSDIPPVLEEVMLKVLAKEPVARYRTADQLGHILVPIRRSLSLPAPGGISVPPVLDEEAAATVQRRVPTPASVEDQEIEEQENVLDLATVLLGLLALIAVGGLVPFWMWVYFR